MENRIDLTALLTVLLFFLTIVLVFFGAYPILTSKEGLFFGTVYVIISMILGCIAAFIVAYLIKNRTAEPSQELKTIEPSSEKKKEGIYIAIGALFGVLGNFWITSILWLINSTQPIFLANLVLFLVSTIAFFGLILLMIKPYQDTQKQ